MSDQSIDIQTKLLIDPWVLLRPVAKDSIEFLEMVTSIDEIGFLNSISVRPSPKKLGYYEVIDGIWRTYCARELDLPVVPCIIKQDITNKQVLALQIQANAIRVKTKPIEFAKQLRRIQMANTEITVNTLASMVNKSPQWVWQQFELLELSASTQKAVDRGEIILSNAYMLSMLPSRLRHNYIDDAKTMASKPFRALAGSVIKHFKEAVKQGKLKAYYDGDFHPQAFLRPLKAIKSEIENPIAAPFSLAETDFSTPVDIWVAALKWALSMDSVSVRDQENKARATSRDLWGGD